MFAAAAPWVLMISLYMVVIYILFPDSLLNKMVIVSAIIALLFIIATIAGVEPKIGGENLLLPSVAAAFVSLLIKLLRIRFPVKEKYEFK